MCDKEAILVLWIEIDKIGTLFGTTNYLKKIIDIYQLLIVILNFNNSDINV